MVYNSNAIENSTLTLEDTEKILAGDHLNRKVNVREIYEAKNLAKITESLQELLQNEPFPSPMHLKRFAYHMCDNGLPQFPDGLITSSVSVESVASVASSLFAKPNKFIYMNYSPQKSGEY